MPTPPLKHSKSSPGYIHRTLSQHSQGSVIRRPNCRPLNVLPPGPLKFLPERCDASPVPPQPIPGPRVNTNPPTLRTVEVTSATKIYLESHFSQLLAFSTNRSLRLHDFERQLQTRVSSEHSKRLLKDGFFKQETAYLRSLRSKPLSIGDYEVVRVIGKGAFGVVKLVREKETEVLPSAGPRSSDQPNAPWVQEWKPGMANRDSPDPNELNESSPELEQQAGDVECRKTSKVYALKVMQKAELLTGRQEGHLRAERDFLVASQGSKWIVPLIAAFQDQENLYVLPNEGCLEMDMTEVLF